MSWHVNVIFLCPRLNAEKTIGYPDCFAVVDPNKDKKAKSGRGRFSVASEESANGERKLVPANYIVDGELEEIDVRKLVQ